ncbi:conserved hypothetical protein [Shewanella halifaxensis HAW-EB4]|uniref:Uncharacterized protein n=1 Tax=Shewanella halifaxensis (strain HAW-EB4) TaxID=458817 RepID=B0TQR6_SHEHH|nr:hypothetical protein [Shewanella halifaxensis]ABZ76311.1 conserved hypothetical protein [Shewanella halifaxensis HAW-EB4]
MSLPIARYHFIINPLVNKEVKVKVPDIKRTAPDVLRVTAFVLEKSEANEPFSVAEAAKTVQLNGINDYRIAEVLRAICLEPNGPNSLISLTTVDNQKSHANPGYWQLNPQTYYSYLSYISLLRSEEAIELAKLSLKAAEKSNQNAKISIWIAIVSIILTAVAILV